MRRGTVSLIKAFTNKESPVTNRRAIDHSTDLMVASRKITGSLNKASTAKGPPDTASQGH